jgi:hypothetical protein
MEVCCKLHALAALSPEKHPGADCIGGSVGPTSGLDDMERRKSITGIEPRFLDGPTRNLVAIPNELSPLTPIRNLIEYALQISLQILNTKHTGIVSNFNSGCNRVRVTTFQGWRCPLHRIFECRIRGLKQVPVAPSTVLQFQQLNLIDANNIRGWCNIIKQHGSQQTVKIMCRYNKKVKLSS